MCPPNTTTVPEALSLSNSRTAMEVSGAFAAAVAAEAAAEGPARIERQSVAMACAGRRRARTVRRVAFAACRDRSRGGVQSPEQAGAGRSMPHAWNLNEFAYLDSLNYVKKPETPWKISIIFESRRRSAVVRDFATSLSRLRGAASPGPSPRRFWASKSLPTITRRGWPLIRSIHYASECLTLRRRPSG